jgi:hypothetical protein
MKGLSLFIFTFAFYLDDIGAILQDAPRFRRKRITHD